MDKHQFGCGVTAVHQSSFHTYVVTHDLHMYMMDFSYEKNHRQKQVLKNWTPNAACIVYSFFIANEHSYITPSKRIHLLH